MAISLSGGVYLEIKINDIELPPANNVFRSLTMHSGIGFEIPVAILEVNDMHDMFNTGDLALVDGSKIEITFGKGNDEAEPRTIKTRILGKVKTEAQSQGYKRTATLIPDLPEYILEVQREAYTGTSDSVLSEIFGKYSIEVSKGQALTCQDSMTWRNIGRSQIQFVKDIVSKAYSGPQTCVKAALDWDTFYINDLFQELKQEPEIGMFNVANVSNKEGAVSLRESSIDTSSGFFNKLTNYGHTHVQHSIDGSLFKYEEAKPVVFGKGIPINEDVKNSIDLTSLTGGKFFDSGTAPLGASNMHENYYKAQYLNMRHLGLFTETVRGLCDSFNHFPLLACVEYEHVNTDSRQATKNEAFSGKYIIGNRTTVFRESHFTEVYTLYRSYVNEAGSTPLVGSENTSSVTPKKTNKAPTAVDPGDPRNTKEIERATNPKVKTQTTEQTEQEQLARELGEHDADAEETSKLDTFNKFVEAQQAKVQKLLDDFEAEGKQFADSAIVKKYGEGKDYLEAVGREFQSAIQKLDEMCGELIPSELAALSLVGPNIGAVLGMLAGRVSQIDKLSGEFEDDLNALVANGDIPQSYLNNAKVNSTCQQIQERINEKRQGLDIPTNCMDRLALAKLFLPQNDLARRLRRLESMINDMLCANGEGASAGATLNGPNGTTATTNV